MLDSASRVDRLVSDLKTKHSAADSRIDAAQAGQVGESATALKSLAAKWRADTTALVTRVTEHGQKLRTAGNAYRDTDEQLADKIKAAGKRADTPDVRL